MRVVHLEDSVPFRLLTRELLADAGIDVVAGAGDSRRGLELVRAEAPDVVLLDGLERGRMAEYVEELRVAAPGTKVVVYSGMPRHAAGVPDALVDAYVQKDCDHAGLLAELRRIAGR
jgi:DNA-binding NarL/FixJ family response regulator